MDDLIRQIEKDFAELVNKIMNDMEQTLRETRGRTPYTEVTEKGDEIIVIADLPGVEKSDIKVNLEGQTLIISASSKDRKYYTELSLPAPVDENSVKANYKNGVLTATLKKVSRGKEIPIE